MYYHRPDREDGINELVDLYPKCFFANPDHRRPLKRDILLDLEKENVMDREKLVQVIDWYE